MEMTTHREPVSQLGGSEAGERERLGRERASERTRERERESEREGRGKRPRFEKAAGSNVMCLWWDRDESNKNKRQIFWMIITSLAWSYITGTGESSGPRTQNSDLEYCIY